MRRDVLKRRSCSVLHICEKWLLAEKVIFRVVSSGAELSVFLDQFGQLLLLTFRGAWLETSLIEKEKRLHFLCRVEPIWTTGARIFLISIHRKNWPKYIYNCRQDTQNLDEDMTETKLAGWPATRRAAHGRLTAAPCIGDHFMLPPPASGRYGRLRIGSRGGRPVVVVAATLTGSTISMPVKSINPKWPCLLGGDTGGSHFHAHRNFTAEVPVWLFPRYSFCISLYYFHQVSITVFLLVF